MRLVPAKIKKDEAKNAKIGRCSNKPKTPEVAKIEVVPANQNAIGNKYAKVGRFVLQNAKMFGCSKKLIWFQQTKMPVVANCKSWRWFQQN